MILTVTFPAKATQQPVAPIQSPNAYIVTDSRTGQRMGTYKTRTGANRAADRLDNAFGAYRYSVQADSK